MSANAPSAVASFVNPFHVVELDNGRDDEEIKTFFWTTFTKLFFTFKLTNAANKLGCLSLVRPILMFVSKVGAPERS